MAPKSHRGCHGALAQYHEGRSSNLKAGDTLGMPSRSEIETFISSNFRSVWSLDLVQFLCANPDQSFSKQQLVTALRASDAVVSQSIASLLAAGLVVNDGDRIGLHVADEPSRRLIEAAVELYGKTPDRVRRLIIAATSPGITAFADAFRLRKD